MGPDANERLTAIAGVTLLVLTLAELGTLVLGLQRFLSWHVFVGFVLLPPIALKLASTGWRFMRYYTRNAAYRERGAPALPMRLIGPVLVAFTVLLFGSGVAMGFVHGQALTLARRVHGPAAFVWTVVLGVHVLVYLPRAVRFARSRAAVAVATLVAGFALGVATLPLDHDWLHLPPKHEHGDGRG